jgi:hypothetical protein
MKSEKTLPSHNQDSSSTKKKAEKSSKSSWSKLKPPDKDKSTPADRKNKKKGRNPPPQREIRRRISWRSPPHLYGQFLLPGGPDRRGSVRLIPRGRCDPGIGSSLMTVKARIKNNDAQCKSKGHGRGL